MGSGARIGEVVAERKGALSNICSDVESMLRTRPFGVQILERNTLAVGRISDSSAHVRKSGSGFRKELISRL